MLNVSKKPFDDLTVLTSLVLLIGGSSMHIWSTDSSVGVDVRRIFWLSLMPPFDGFSIFTEVSRPLASTIGCDGMSVCISYISSVRMFSVSGDVVGGKEDCSLLIMPLLFLQ